ncbi:MAG: rhodanese-related sulfurtransferase [Pseudomonadota bacterium]|nr:rhodanese-related sulfurtransferase [Pseudomonadota bacterium]
MSIAVAALYQFKPQIMTEELRQSIYDCCSTNHVLGTLLLADEGVNGTISGCQQNLERVVSFLIQIGFNQLELKYSHAEQDPFLRLKVLWKKEIVTLGRDVDPCMLVGEYVEVSEWNDLITQEDVLLIDTRNNYEYELGTFKGAENPNTECFREFPRYVAGIDRNKFKRVAMFCTGGIRCEKASSYMLSEGFEEVYHLKGGVLKYLEEIDRKNSLWEGDCFVFDRRVAVKHGLELSDLGQCYACRRALTVEDMQHPDYVKGVSCHRCVHITSKERQASFAERQRQVELAVMRSAKHIGSRVSSTSTE